MRVPLMNCEPDALQEEASEYFDEIGVQMKEDLKKTQQRLKDKIPFEDELVSQLDCRLVLSMFVSKCHENKSGWEIFFSQYNS